MDIGEKSQWSSKHASAVSAERVPTHPVGGEEIHSKGNRQMKMSSLALGVSKNEGSKRVEMKQRWRQPGNKRLRV